MIRAFLCTALILGCVVSTASAQQIPASADSARAEDLNQSRSLDQPQPMMQITEFSHQFSPSLIPDDIAGRTFLVKTVAIDGMTAYQPDDFQEIYSSFIGQTVSVEEIYGWADKMTQRYWADGYSLSRVVVSPGSQMIDGDIRLKAVEGYIEDIVAESSMKHNDMISRIAGVLIGQKPVAVRQIERAALLADDIPGVKVKFVLDKAESGEAGALALHILTESEPVKTVLQLDNFGSRYAGPYILTAQSVLPNLFDHPGETQLTLAGSMPLDEMAYVSITHTVPVTDRISAGATAGYSKVTPGYLIDDENIESRSASLNIFTEQKMIVRRDERLTLRQEFDIKDSDVDVFNDIAIQRDKLRVLRAGLQYESSDEKTLNDSSATVSHGLEILGATESGSSDFSRAQARGDFIKLELEYSRICILPKDFFLTTAFSAQIAGSPLPASEEFGYGGQSFGRGYDYSEITGDDGAAFLMELTYNLGDLTNDIRGQMFVFYDIGQIHNRDDGGGTDSAASAGIGIRAFHQDGFSGDFTIAKPLTKDASAPRSGGRDDIRALFSIRKDFEWDKESSLP